MSDKILGFQFVPVCLKRTGLSYSYGSGQNETETQRKKFSTQEWSNCRKCKKIQTCLECMHCHKIAEVKAFNLKGEARSL